MGGKRIILNKQSCKTWLGVLINYTNGHFMDVVDFIITIPSMTHPDYWTLIKLWSDKRLHKTATPLNPC